MEDQLYMTAEEAAQALGVNVATVYAYVSRKILRAYRPPGVRSSKYWRADVERIRSKAPAPGHDTDPLVSQTQITAITDSQITLRETVQDPTGEWIERTSTLQLQEKAR